MVLNDNKWWEMCLNDMKISQNETSLYIYIYIYTYLNYCIGVFYCNTVKPICESVNFNNFLMSVKHISYHYLS